MRPFRKRKVVQELHWQIKVEAAPARYLNESGDFVYIEAVYIYLVRAKQRIRIRPDNGGDGLDPSRENFQQEMAAYIEKAREVIDTLEAANSLANLKVPDKVT